ncbi:hypothetical protein SSS_05339 [Sarcoptes scabiei]|nr:hypothetical protein SSS_05339 [Sarcoptes scabiei]
MDDLQTEIILDFRQNSLLSLSPSLLSNFDVNQSEFLYDHHQNHFQNRFSRLSSRIFNISNMLLSILIFSVYFSVSGAINLSTISDPSLSSSHSRSKHSLSELTYNNRKDLLPYNENDPYSDDDSIVKCFYYNQTLCRDSNNQEGCGQTIQVCHPIDVSDHSQKGQAYCYALWRNSTSEGVQMVFKGCWFGSSHSCSNEEHGSKFCVPTHPPKQKNLNFCCCQGTFCNREIEQMPEIYAHSTESLEQDIIENTMERHGHADPLANIKIYVFLFITIIFFVFIGIVIAVFVGKCPKKPNSNDVVTNEPLLEVSNSVTTGYIGTHPIQLEKALAHGKFGTVWHVSV